MIVVLFIIGYLLTGSIVSAVTSNINNEDPTVEDFYMVIIFLWPLYLVLTGIWGIAICFNKIADVIRRWLRSFINWMRSDTK